MEKKREVKVFESFKELHDWLEEQDKEKEKKKDTKKTLDKK